jgi:hypothetical protein
MENAPGRLDRHGLQRRHAQLIEDRAYTPDGAGNGVHAGANIGIGHLAAQDHGAAIDRHGGAGIQAGGLQGGDRARADVPGDVQQHPRHTGCCQQQQGGSP